MERLSKFLRKHAIPVVIVTCLVSLAAAANIWVAFTKETIPDFFIQRGWLLAMPSWYHALIAALAIAIVGAQATLIYALFKIRPVVVVTEVKPSVDAEPPSFFAEMTTISNHHYMNESIEIDGKNFEFCRFDNVTFVFNGRAQWAMKNPSFPDSGSIKVQSQNPIVKASLLLSDAVRRIASMKGVQGASYVAGHMNDQGLIDDLIVKEVLAKSKQGQPTGAAKQKKRKAGFK